MREADPGLASADQQGAGGADLTVIYIGGPGRTGSTILGNALNELPGHFHAGELLALWQMLASGSPTRCGCGLPIPECPIWSRVLGTRLPENGMTIGEEAERAYSWLRSISFSMVVRRLRAGSLLPPGEATDAYLRLLRETYLAIRAATGARVIVDSSKAPVSAAALRMLPSVRRLFVHLVRDPRAVAYSWLTPKGHLVRQPVLFTARHWRRANLATAAVIAGLPPGSSVTIRYEDFATAPAQTLGHVLAALGEGRPPLPFLEDGELLLTGNHTVIGNPDRHVSGRVRLTPDSRWEKGLSAWDAALVSVAAYSGMRRYGYRWLGSWRTKPSPAGSRVAREARDWRPARLLSVALAPLAAVAVLLGGRPRRALATAGPAGAALALMSAWWLLAASAAAPVRGVVPLRPLAEVASHVASIPLPSASLRHATARKGLILNHPWPFERPAVGKAEAERTAKRAIEGRPRVAGAVLASIETVDPSDVDCLCWVVFVRRAGNVSFVNVVLVDAEKGRPIRADRLGVKASSELLTRLRAGGTVTLG